MGLLRLWDSSSWCFCIGDFSKDLYCIISELRAQAHRYVIMYWELEGDAIGSIKKIQFLILCTFDDIVVCDHDV